MKNEKGEMKKEKGKMADAYCLRKHISHFFFFIFHFSFHIEMNSTFLNGELFELLEIDNPHYLPLARISDCPCTEIEHFEQFAVEFLRKITQRRNI